MAIAAAAIGAISSYSSAKSQKKAADKAAQPQPFWSGPPAWLEPYIRESAGMNRDFFMDQINNPRLPPTFQDVVSGRYGQPIPSSPIGGIEPGLASTEVENAWKRNQKRLNERLEAAGSEQRQLTDRERQAIAARVNARRGGHDPFPGRGPIPVGRTREGGIPGGVGGGGRDGEFGGNRLQMKGGGGQGMNPREQLARILLARAQQPVMGQAEGMGFLQNLMGRQGPDMSALNAGLGQQQQTYNDFRDPSSPVNQMIQRGMQGSFSSAAPMQQQLAQRLMGGMGAPPPSTPTSYFDRYFQMAGPESDFRLFDTGGV